MTKEETKQVINAWTVIGVLFLLTQLLNNFVF
jgi:hypothetical protein